MSLLLVITVILCGRAAAEMVFIYGFKHLFKFLAFLIVMLWLFV